MFLCVCLCVHLRVFVCHYHDYHHHNHHHHTMIKTVNSGKFTQATTALCPLVAWWLFYVAHPFIADRMTDFGASRLTVFHNFRNNMESSMTYWSFLTWLDLTWLDLHGMNACISVSTNRGVRMCLLKVSHKAKVASWLDLTSLSLYVKRPLDLYRCTWWEGCF